jgi:hypothetical protein
MAGQHKLWKLDKKTAKNALQGLRDCEQMPISFLSHKEQHFSQLDGMAFSPSQARHPPFHLTQFTNIYDNIETRVS